MFSYFRVKSFVMAAGGASYSNQFLQQVIVEATGSILEMQYGSGIRQNDYKFRAWNQLLTQGRGNL